MEMVSPHGIPAKHIRPLKRVEFEKLCEQGFFEDERVELLFGTVVEMPAPAPEHDESMMRLGERLVLRLAGRARVRIGAAFAASDISLPIPDVMIAPQRDYWSERPSEALLIVEVSRTSLRRDRGLKLELYGLARVDEYWVVNHRERCVEVFRDPRDGEWGSHSVHGSGEVIAPLHFPDLLIPVDDILPPPGDVIPPDEDDLE